MQQAVIVGVGLVVLLFVCAAIGAKALVALITVVVVLATAEFFTATRRGLRCGARRPGRCRGLRARRLLAGEGPFPSCSGRHHPLLVVVRCGPADHAVANVGITVFGIMYVGGFGSFAALLKFPTADAVRRHPRLGGGGHRRPVRRSAHGESPLTAASPNKTSASSVGSSWPSWPRC
jgi:hypothetical protein